jgi:arylsulfatase A-like enzyme
MRLPSIHVRPYTILFALSAVFLNFTQYAEAADSAKPNVVIVFLDDAGYGDFHPFGSPAYPTPNVQKLADEGRTFTRFYVPQAVCSASRAALMTGCYPGRTGVFGAHGPNGRGLETKFATMAEVLKQQDYTTAIFGKWHLGDQEDTRPWARGFDESCGLLYSNDMWSGQAQWGDRFEDRPLHFWENGEVAIEDISHEDQAMLTTWYTEHAVSFIDRNKDNPFFLYVPHTMPHVPIYASEKFKGKSGQGIYADVMMELDWSVGEIMKALEKNGVAGNTLFIFTSDNGPWASYGNHAGKTPFRASKLTSFDGGIRSPCVVRFPGRIPAGTTSDTAFSSMDLLPTIANLAGALLPDPLDGRDAWSVIAHDTPIDVPHDYFPISTIRTFEGVVSGDGRWKLHLPHSYRAVIDPGLDGASGKIERVDVELTLYDLKNDPRESTNVIDAHPEVAERLSELAQMHYDRFYADLE